MAHVDATANLSDVPNPFRYLDEPCRLQTGSILKENNRRFLLPVKRSAYLL
jgi:hypothetical protein